MRLISFVPPIIIAIIFIFFIAIVMKNKFGLLKFYLTVVSLVSVIGLVIGYGIGIYALAQKAIITDQEYLANQNRYYGYDTCADAKVVGDTTTPVKPTEEEAKECQEKRDESAIIQRDFEMKENIIGGVVRGTLALILFLIHYPMLLKKSKQTEEE